MSEKDAATPRVFLIRHGETEWSRNGRYTGVTDLPLLPEGEARVRQSASVVFGSGRLIDPAKVSTIICSPRQRARRTLELLLERIPDDGMPKIMHKETQVTEEIAEWGYGDYEGLLTHQIEALRRERGLDRERPWDIWRDGCEGEKGESPLGVTGRLDGVIHRITSIQARGMAEKKHCDVVVVAHGHILRAFVKRWLGWSLDTKLELMLEPGGICGLSYAHGDIGDRAVLVGMGFPGPS